MKYMLNFYCEDTGKKADLQYYGQSTPLIPKVGDRVWAGLLDQTGVRYVRSITYGYSEDLNSVLIVVGLEDRNV